MSNQKGKTMTQEHDTDTTYTVDRNNNLDADPFAFETIAECSDHASAYATVIADYTKMNTGQRLVWTRPKWTAVSGKGIWAINIRKSDGTLIMGSTMGPTRLELEKQQVTDEPPFFVIVLHVKDRVARYVEGNFSGPDYILGNEKSEFPLSDGWWMGVVAKPSPFMHTFGPFPTWKQAETLARHIDEAPTLEHAVAIGRMMPAPEAMH